MNTNRTAEIAKAREVDTEVARLYDLFHEINNQIRVLKKYIDDEKKYGAKSYNQSERRQAEIAANIARYEGQIEKLQPVADERKAAAEKFNADNYEGWSRFFLVQHIHSNMYCSSFRPTTRIGWLPNVSGLTEAEAVAEHGATLCTICFPSAPVELTVKPVDDKVCPGSGKYSREYRRYVKCEDCGQTVNRISGSGKIRKHNKPTN